MRKKRIFTKIFVVSGAALVLLVSASASCCGNNLFTSEGTARGYALAIGLNSLDPAHYGGWHGALTGCEPDAEDMREIAQDLGFEAETLLTAQATRTAVINKITQYAGRLKKGDLLVVSYSGHGGQVPDQNGDEADGLDETWCLYDGQMLDDELRQLWGRFAKGVRILAFSDSCHSGTVMRMMRSDWENPTRMDRFKMEWDGIRELRQLDRERIRPMWLERLRERRPRPVVDETEAEETPEVVEEAVPEPEEPPMILKTRAIPPGISMKTFSDNREMYENIGRNAIREDAVDVEASLILISGCKDDQTSADLGFNGLFTWKLVMVWNNGGFQGDHNGFHQAIQAAVQSMNPGQVPNFDQLGICVDKFVAWQPYSLTQ